MTVASYARDAGGGPGETEPRRADVKKERRDWRQFVGFVPAAILFGVFFIAPLCLIVVYSFWITKNYELVPDFTTDNYKTILATSTYVRTFGKTVLMAFLATVTALALAFPFCYWLVRYVPKSLQRVGLLLVILPFWTSYLLRVYAWVAILGDNGAINSMLKALGLTDASDPAVPVRQPRRVHRLGVPVLPVRGAHAVRIAGEIRLAAAARGGRPRRHPDARHRKHASSADAAGVGDGRESSCSSRFSANTSRLRRSAARAA